MAPPSSIRFGPGWPTPTSNVFQIAAGRLNGYSHDRAEVHLTECRMRALGYVFLIFLVIGCWIIGKSLEEHQLVLKR